ncbi:hypothetical protein J6590_100678 [Homalodisca vitripennis]|nr:hypothetical protein J6590_100678 [Homalodisca vitripennis]
MTCVSAWALISDLRVAHLVCATDLSNLGNLVDVQEDDCWSWWGSLPNLRSGVRGTCHPLPALTGEATYPS